MAQSSKSKNKEKELCKEQITKLKIKKKGIYNRKPEKEKPM